MDNLTSEQRKKNMQNIRSTNTLPERKIMQALKKKKIYFAKNVKSIIGKPDIVFRRKKVVVFIDSDFWHGHPKRGVMPKSNRNYWLEKIKQNKERDRKVNRELRKQGWFIIRLWEYDIKKKFDKSLEKVLTVLGKGEEH